MKKLLILIVFAAVFLHFYPQPWLTSWFEEKKDLVMEEVAEVTDTSVRLKADKIFTDIKDKYKSFNEEEIQYLQQLTTSRKKVEDFFQKHCEQKAFDGHFNPSNLKKVCETINKYRSYF